MTKPLLLGEIPSAAEGPDAWQRPLSGRVSKMLCQLADLTPNTYENLSATFECANAVIKRYDGFSWSVSYTLLQSRTRFEQFVELGHRDAVVCLGRRAASAAGLDPDHAWGQWIGRYGGPAITVIPHPSGLNRLYNDPIFRDVARLVLRQALVQCGS